MRKHRPAQFVTRHSPAPGPREGLAHRPALDGVRGLAILAVLAYHFGVPGWGGGFLGVDLFFVLSGFLIASLLAAERATTGRVDLLRFWARRARRLLPALITVAIAIAAWTRLDGSWDTWALRRDELLATLGYIANWQLIAASSDYFAGVAGAASASPLQHAWSLGIEEQFYLFWPVLFAVAVHLEGRRRVVPIAAAVLLVVASVAAAAALYDPAAPSRAYYGTDARIHQILVGVVLALAMRPWRRVQAMPIRERRAFAWAQLPLAAVLVAGFVVADATGPFYYRGGSLLVALAAAALIAAIERVPDGAVGRLLSWRPIVLVGVISYGLYLWHWPVVLATAPADPAADTLPLVPLRLALTFGLAAVTFVAIERPIREGRLPVIRRSSWRTMAASAAAIAVAAGISVGATDLGLPGGAPPPTEALAPSDDSVSVSYVLPLDMADPTGAPTPVASPGAALAAAPTAAPTPAFTRVPLPTPTPVPTPTPTPTPEPVPALGQAEVAASVADFARWQCPSATEICTRAAGKASAPTLVTFGDSSIGSLDVGLTEWAMGSGATYVVAASGGCTISGVPRSNDPTKVQKGPMDAKCEARYDSIVDQVAALPGPVVVLATAVSEYRPVILPDGSLAAFGTAAHLEALDSGLEALAARLDRPDVTLVLLGPAGHTLKPNCLTAGTDACSLDGYDREWAAQAQVAGAFAQVAARHPGRVRFAGLDDLVCPQGGPCSSWRGGTLVRWDGIHYTRPGSRIIAGELMERLRVAGVPLP